LPELIAHTQSVHTKKAGWDFALRLSLLFSIVCGRIADALAKQCAERAEALKTYFEADIGNRQAPVSEQLLRLFNSAVNQILMWSGLKLFAKQTKKMIAGQAGFSRNLIQIDRLLIALVDESARATESLVNLAAGIDSHLRHFGARILMQQVPQSEEYLCQKPDREGGQLSIPATLKSCALAPHCQASDTFIPTDNSALLS